MLEVARFLLNVRTGGHPITGALGDLKYKNETVRHKNEAYVVVLDKNSNKEVPASEVDVLVTETS